jgi:enoyl-CoA hydratase/carnithine racemase
MLKQIDNPPPSLLCSASVPALLPALLLEQAAPILADKLVEVLSTADAMEGISAFLQKRKPDWKGR